MATTLHTQLVLDALKMALWQRRPNSVIHHSDQGSQYTSIEFGKRCRQAGVRPSMGSVGDAYDNAMAESFFATLECELLDRRRRTLKRAWRSSNSSRASTIHAVGNGLREELQDELTGCFGAAPPDRWGSRQDCVCGPGGVWAGLPENNRCTRAPRMRARCLAGHRAPPVRGRRYTCPHCLRRIWTRPAPTVGRHPVRLHSRLLGPRTDRVALEAVNLGRLATGRCFAIFRCENIPRSRRL